MRPIPAIAAALTLAACTSSSTPPAVTAHVSVAPAPAPAGSSPCTDMLKPGGEVTIKDGDLACHGPDGGSLMLILAVCKDGTHMAGTVPAGRGYPPGWFIAPGPYHVTAAGDPGDDPAYQAAYQKCVT